MFSTEKPKELKVDSNTQIMELTLQKLIDKCLETSKNVDQNGLDQKNKNLVKMPKFLIDTITFEIFQNLVKHGYHGDIKPFNVILKMKGDRNKFGEIIKVELCRSEERVQKDSHQEYTISFMPPEGFLLERQGCRDIWIGISHLKMKSNNKCYNLIKLLKHKYHIDN